MIKETTTKYTFNKEQFAMIKKCLVYCIHRIKDHGNSGIGRTLSANEIHYLKSLEGEIYKK